MLTDTIFASGLLYWSRWAASHKRRLIRARPFRDAEGNDCFEMFHVSTSNSPRQTESAYA